MTKEHNKQSIREFTKTFKNEHNVDGIDHLFEASFRHNFKVQVSPGLEGLKEIGRIMNTAFPDVVVTENDLIADERTVVERSSAVATNSGPYMNYPPTNKKIKWTEIHIYRFNDEGKIVEHWAEISSLELMLQIEAVQMKVEQLKPAIVVLATAKAMPGKIADLQQALLDVAAPTRAQHGCLQFGVYRSAQDPGAITAIEYWGSNEDHERHLQGDHVKTLIARFNGILASQPEIIPLIPL